MVNQGKSQNRNPGRPPKPTAFDLFSGCGGMTLGLRQAGFKVIGAVDNDPLSVETYRKNHKGVKVWEIDIRNLSVSEVKKELGIRTGELDLLAGCPPCQGFSSMRTMNGGRRVRDPEQKDLVFEFLRFVRGLRPKAVMMENVPGLASDSRMRELVRELKLLGYKCNNAILNAADYGVPQRRKRVILLASLMQKIEFAPSDPNRPTVRDAIADLAPAGKSGDPLHDLPEIRSEKVRQLITRIPRNGGSRAALGKRQQLRCHRKFSGFKDVYGRMSWDDVAPTITSGCVNPSKGRFLHPTYNRAITLREAALLQTFPPDYFISLKRGKYPAAGLIGNALPPHFIRCQALQVIKALRLSERS
jgi:DNA (cytosine-5)-methyltransferase 1